ncbi:unnamed protein product [Macrosiphum euphorbiae]|uniref:Uncharacterized protein n=1 Tax=Macrosiphum euphorbiae TaxID=13131 RepID=A0AAV0VN66_9HEMI|nr:unnamed protein product [Macrosiphum euphorbiae]CAI6363931.1 unnamed protein product [Macrosiphum euphorbiae]
MATDDYNTRDEYNTTRNLKVDQHNITVGRRNTGQYPQGPHGRQRQRRPMTRETGQLVVDTPARRHNMQNSQPGRYHVGWEGEYARLVGGLQVESPTLIAARFCDDLRKHPPPPLGRAASQRTEDYRR